MLLTNRQMTVPPAPQGNSSEATLELPLDSYYPVIARVVKPTKTKVSAHSSRRGRNRITWPWSGEDEREALRQLLAKLSCSASCQIRA